MALFCTIYLEKKRTPQTKTVVDNQCSRTLCLTRGVNLPPRLLLDWQGMFVADWIAVSFTVCQCVSVSVWCSVLQRALPRKDVEAIPGSSLKERVVTLRLCAVCMGNTEYFPATRCKTLRYNNRLRLFSGRVCYVAHSRFLIVADRCGPHPLVVQHLWAAWIVRSAVVQCSAMHCDAVWCSAVQHAACLDYELFLWIEPSSCKFHFEKQVLQCVVVCKRDLSTKGACSS